MATPVCILKRIMPEMEFQQWMLYHRHYPLDDQANHHEPVARLSALMFNINRGKDARPLTALDFLPYREKPPVEDEDIEALLLGGGW